MHANEVGDLNLCHRLLITVDEKDFVFRWRETFKQEHPEVRHNISRHPIVWTVEQNVHIAFLVNREESVCEAAAPKHGAYVTGFQYLSVQNQLGG